MHTHDKWGGKNQDPKVIFQNGQKVIVFQVTQTSHKAHAHKNIYIAIAAFKNYEKVISYESNWLDH